MQIEIYIKTKNNSCYADAIYTDEGITVKAGGTISEDFAEHIRGGNKIKAMRSDLEYVVDRKIIKDCHFNSPSTAAQFVTGRSINGYEAWKVEKKISLGDYLKEKGLR